MYLNCEQMYNNEKWLAGVGIQELLIASTPDGHNFLLVHLKFKLVISVKPL